MWKTKFLRPTDCSKTFTSFTFTGSFLTTTWHLWKTTELWTEVPSNWFIGMNQMPAASNSFNSIDCKWRQSVGQSININFVATSIVSVSLAHACCGFYANLFAFHHFWSVLLLYERLLRQFIFLASFRFFFSFLVQFTERDRITIFK